MRAQRARPAGGSFFDCAALVLGYWANLGWVELAVTSRRLERLPVP